MTNQTDQQPESSPTRPDHYIVGYSPLTRQRHASRTVVRQAAFFLPHLRPGMSLLDCGCGPGTITIGLAQIVNPGQVVGIDMESSMVERARALGREQGLPNVHFQVANVFELPFSDGSFDAIFAHTLLYHLNQPLTNYLKTLAPYFPLPQSGRGDGNGSWGTPPVRRQKGRSPLCTPPGPVLR